MLLKNLTIAIALLLVVGAKSMLPNQTPGLAPQNGGIWRGATHWKWQDTYQYDPETFKAEFGRDLHIYRTFKSCWQPDLFQAEIDFIAKGGILFFSIQSNNWAKDVVDPKSIECLRKMARAVKAVAPAQMYVCPGYEPDSHASPQGGDVFGTIPEYLAYRKKVKEIFDSEGATNSIWVMDYSNHGANEPGHFDKAFADLMPDDGSVQFLFFNIFQMVDKKAMKQRRKQGKSSKNWDSSPSLKWFYEYFTDEKNPKYNAWKDIPQGIGAWGSLQLNTKDKTKFTRNLKAKDRKTFINNLTDDQESGKYPKIKAAIWFDSLESIITKVDPKQIRHYNRSVFGLNQPGIGSPHMVPTITRYLKNSKFDLADEYLESDQKMQSNL